MNHRVGLRLGCAGLHHDRAAATLADLDRDEGRQSTDLQDELLAHARLLAEFGPNLGRPTVDTLKGSRHTKMKELRFSCNGQVWPVAFAFDPQRQAILLIGGDKGDVDDWVRRWRE